MNAYVLLKSNPTVALTAIGYNFDERFIKDMVEICNEKSNDIYSYIAVPRIYGSLTEIQSETKFEVLP